MNRQPSERVTLYACACGHLSMEKGGTCQNGRQPEHEPHRIWTYDTPVEYVPAGPREAPRGYGTADYS